MSRIIILTLDKITGECRKIHKRKPHNMYSLPDFIKVFTSSRMIWTGHVKQGPQNFLPGWQFWYFLLMMLSL
jgi:hypothetical protein